MSSRPVRRTVAVAASGVVALGMAGVAEAQLPPLSPAAGVCPAPAPRPVRAGGGEDRPPTPALPGRVFDQAVPAGENFEVGEFRLWIPDGVESVRAVLVLAPGAFMSTNRPMS